MSGAELIAAERSRQMTEEGWTPDHDDGHLRGSLAVVAAHLACHGTDASVHDPHDRGTWGLVEKHGYSLRSLVIAGALIAAEIDRRIRRGETP